MNEIKVDDVWNDTMTKYEELLVALRRIIRAIDLHSKKLSKETGLTGPQLALMREVAAHDENVSVKDVATNINLSSATVTTIIDRLETRGLINRVRSSTDRRKVSLYLTTSGREILESAPKPLQEHFIARFEALEEWEQTQLLATMQRIAKMMDADNIDASPILEVGALNNAE